MARKESNVLRRKSAPLNGFVSQVRLARSLQTVSCVVVGERELKRAEGPLAHEKQDEAFISIAVAKRRFDAQLGQRLLAFARHKRRPVARVVAELGLVETTDAAQIARLARYRVARAEDKVYAEVAARAGVIDRREAAAVLVRQRDLYADGRGFIRLAALLRSDKRITPETDRMLRSRVRAFEKAPKKECVRETCRALLLVTDEVCPTCGAHAPIPVANPSGSEWRLSEMSSVG